MSYRSFYLAKYRTSKSQRAHFAIFIPNADSDSDNLGHDFRSRSCKGTVIHVVGEPVMAGYTLEIKRNYECSTSQDLKKLVLLGYVDTCNVYEPKSSSYVKETSPRSTLERHASTVPPPPRGQNVRAPIDGVGCRRDGHHSLANKL